MRLFSSSFAILLIALLKLAVAAPAISLPLTISPAIAISTPDATFTPNSPYDPNSTYIPDSTYSPNSTYNISGICSNPSHGLDSICWQTLNLTGYVNDWWAANGAGCDELGFGQCFLDAMGLASMSCSEVNINSCPAPSATNLTAEDFYIVYAIYGKPPLAKKSIDRR